MQPLSADMLHCIDDCLHCYRICTTESMNHCLETGGPHTEPEHFRLMTHCAEICRTAASFMLGNSHLHAVVCSACAEVCRACAESCRQVGDMDECMQACLACMNSCGRMAQGAGQGFTQYTTPLQDHLPM